MSKLALRRSLLALSSVLMLTLSGLAAAEPPSRAARLGYIGGAISFSPAGQPDWVQAVVNRPLTTGDRLWSDINSRAELQVGGAAIRLGAATSVTLLNLDDRIVQVQLSQGTLKVRVRRLGPDQTFEIDTPNLAFTLRRPGEYRIDVDPNADATAVMVQSGEAEVYGDGASYAVNPRQGYRFYGTGLSDYEPLATRRDDDLDRWARDRDRRGDDSPSARFVSPEVIGYEDLDANGTWHSDPSYGNVWTPTRVVVGWTPYRDGHWIWVDPWGWTWVDDAPWGFAVSHYGRWANINGSWGWVPGPPREQAVYAPALVAFVGGKNFQVSVSVGGVVAAAVGWFPLAPREVYQPSYPVSRGYFDNINRSNAVIAPTTITNVYNTTNVTNNTTVVNNTTNIVKVVYANQQVAGAVIAVPAQAFVQSQSVAKVAMPLSREAAVNATVAHVAAVAPVQQSVHGGAPDAAVKPPAQEQAVVARTAPPLPPVPFAVQQRQLAAKPGTPIDEGQRTQLKPAAPAAPAPKVNVVTTANVPVPTALPPTIPPAGKSPDARKVSAPNGEAPKPDGTKPAAASAEASRAGAADANDTRAAAAAKAEALGADAATAERARSTAAKADAMKAEALRATNAAKVEAARSDAAKAEAAKADAAKGNAARAAEAKDDASKAEAGKADAARAAAARAEATKAEASRATDEAKVEAARADAVKADAARAAAAKNDASKAEAGKADAARAAAARAEATKAEASRATDAAKVDAARADAAKADAARAAAAKNDASKAEAGRADAARAAAVRAEVMKAEASRATDAAKVEAARADVARADAAKAEAARADATRAAAAKAEAAKVDAARVDAARAATSSAEVAKADAARGANAKTEAARAAAAKAPASAPAPAVQVPVPKSESELKADAEKKKTDEDARKR